MAKPTSKTGLSKKSKLTRVRRPIAGLGSLAKFARDLAHRMGSSGTKRSARRAKSLGAVRPRGHAGAGAGTLAGIADHVMRMRLARPLEAIEIALLTRALEQAGGNITATGRLLGIHRKAVERALVKHKLGRGTGRRRRRSRAGR